LQEHDRYFYFASVATSIGIAYLIVGLRRFGALLQGATLLVLFGAMAALTFNYSFYWDNDIRLFTRATQIAGDNPNAYQYLAFVYMNQGQPGRAEAIAQSLIHSSDLRTMGWYILGMVRLQDKEYEQAREAMQTGFKLSQGKDLLTTIGLAGTDLKLGKNEEAAQIYEEALKKYPDMAYLHGNLAEAYEGMGRSREAAREFELQRRLK
jgi:tetratricopeptide (TPR) repeat protein